MSTWTRKRAWTALIFLMAAAVMCFAHPAVPTVALVKVSPEGGVRVTVIHDALAYALNDTSARIGDPEMYALLKGPPDDLAAALLDAAERMTSGFQLISGGQPVPFRIARAPSVADVARWKSDNPGLGLPVKLEFELEASLPPGTASIAFRFPPVLSDVLLSIDRPGVETFVLPISPGEISPLIDVRIGTPDVIETLRPPNEPAGVWGVAWRYTRLGYRHIIPEGTDHALFVLGLFLLSPRFKSIMWQICAFTSAHTITLTLAALHLVSIPASIVEPTIAASIVFVAAENLFSKRVHRWRPLVAFVFGLVHGLGFASSLAEIGLPTGRLAAAIVSFSVGVEAGHLSVLLVAFALLGWCRGRAWYRKAVLMPLSLMIAVIAASWMIERLWSGA